MLIDCIVTGDVILKVNPEVKGRDGQPLDPNKKYRWKKYQSADHFTEMKLAYKRDGDQGVIDYCKRVHAYAKSEKAKQVEEEQTL